ncbi:AB hydrolase-1 domain-containing protein [Fusarium sp. LHS14.1]|nr:AB hydrolase-1 domain-containing protein [Fusarium sp. LHS14.1]
MSTTTNSTALSHTFNYELSTHSYTVKWGSLGDPNSPPLILIHGTPWSSRLWEPFALSLSRQFHVYIFDRPGFGESPAERKLPGAAACSSPIVEYDGDLARQSEVYAALFKSWQADWGSQKPHVVAHDNAGLVSLRAHLLHDCQYASLCLIDVVAIGPFGIPLFKVVADAPQHFQQLPAMAFDGILESYIRNAAFSELSKETMQSLKAPWLREGGKEGFIRELCQANSRTTDEVEGRYGEVGTSIPVKIIWGAEDIWIPAEDAHRLGKALKAQEVVIIEDAGHLIMLDQPAQLGVELTRWLCTISQAN